MRGRRSTTLIGSGVLVAMLLAGCGGGTATTAGPTTSEAPASAAASSVTVTPTPAESTPTAGPTKKPKSGSERQADGTLLVTDTDAGFQVVIPRGYTKINNRDQLTKVIRAGSKALTGRESSLAASAFADNVKVFAIDNLTGATINIVTTPSGGALSADLPAQAPAVKALLKQRFRATQVTTKTVTVDGETALRADCTLTMGAVNAHLTQVYAVHGEDMVVMTIGVARLDENLVTRVVRSVRFL